MIQQREKPKVALESIAIVGVGLIGGSIAAAAKARGLVTTVVGIGRRAARLEQAREAGLIDEAATEVATIGHAVDLIVFCTPVDQIVSGVQTAAAACKPGTVITDAGSVKENICRQLATGLPPGVEFIGSHPLAGSEKSGFEFADARLFEGRTCILTPVETSSPDAIERVRDFWRGLGATTREMSPASHDRALAETSHLPHLLAASLASVLSEDNRPFTATGFRDTTRIASGDPDLWTAILLGNADELLRRLDAHHETLEQFRKALITRDSALMRQLLQTAKTSRDALLIP